MSRLTRKQKLALNPTVDAMRRGLMTYRRRMDVQMWHIDHLGQTIEIIDELSSELKRIKGSNSLRNVDKCTYAQGSIMYANRRFSMMRPSDPRPRGSEDLVYDPYLIDRRGHAELQKRDDLKEPHNNRKVPLGFAD